MGAINSVPRWYPFGAPPALPPTKPAGTRRSSLRGAANWNANNGDDSSVTAHCADHRDRRTSLSDSNQSLAFSDGGSVISGMGVRSDSKIMGTSAPPLYENALVGEWSALRARAETHPSEAEYADRRCNAAIHLVCRRQPKAEVVRALLKADPAGASRVTADGMTPLHFAAYCGAGTEVVRMLLEAADAGRAQHGDGSGGAGSGTAPQSQPPPQSSAVGGGTTNAAAASSFDRRGRTPLHLVLSGFRTPHRPEVVSLLLCSDPSGATRADERGRTPLSLLYDDYAEEVEDALSAAVTEEEARKMCVEEEGELHECWTILNLLLRTGYHGTVPETEREPKPEQPPTTADEKKGDEDGGMDDENDEGVENRCEGASPPLAARRSSSALSSSARLASPPAEVDLLNGPYRPLHAAVGVYETPPKFVRLMLRVFPRAAEEKDGDFNLPLHVAARAVPAEHERQKRGAFRSGGGVLSGGGIPTLTTGVVMKGSTLGRGSIGASGASGAGGGVGVGGAAGSTPEGRVYNADFGRGGHGHHGGGAIHRDDSGERRRSSGHGGWTAVSTTSNYGTLGSGKKNPPHTAISDLIHAYPEAASIPDESGRYALVLAIESGKNWDRGVRPILDAYPDAFVGESLLSVQGALVGALASPVAAIREETASTMAGLSSRWGGAEEREGGRRRGSRGTVSVNGLDFDEESSADEGDWSDPEDIGSVSNPAEEDKAAGADERKARKGKNEFVVELGAFGNGDRNTSAVSLVNELVRMAGISGCGQSSELHSSVHGSRHGSSKSADDACTQSASLQALASLYTNIPKRCLTLPGSAEAGLNVAVEMLRHEKEAVRESAAKCVGSALELLDGDSAKGVMRDIIDQHQAGRGIQGGRGRKIGRRSLSRRFSGSALSGVTGGSGRFDEEKTEDESDMEESEVTRHGRAAATYRILSCSGGEAVSGDVEMFRSCTFLVRDLMLDDDASVRRAACLAVGVVLNRSSDPSATLREVRKSIGKCMRVSEDQSVHMSLARGLILARMKRHDVFLCKAGMPILDGALMLAVSSAISPPVQRMFHGFLWLALGVGGKEDEKGLSKYMRLAEGENGRIMMTLVSKTLKRIEHVEEGEW